MVWHTSANQWTTHFCQPVNCTFLSTNELHTSVNQWTTHFCQPMNYTILSTNELHTSANQWTTHLSQPTHYTFLSTNELHTSVNQWTAHFSPPVNYKKVSCRLSTECRCLNECLSVTSADLWSLSTKETVQCLPCSQTQHQRYLSAAFQKLNMDSVFRIAENKRVITFDKGTCWPSDVDNHGVPNLRIQVAMLSLIQHA